MSGFYHVQRLNARDNERKTGFDRLFDLDYMGSSEFEWGAPGRSLTAIRAQPVTVTATLVAMGEITRTVYFVGNLTPETLAQFELWITWDGHRRCRGQERLAWLVDSSPAAFLRGLYDSEGNLTQVARIFSTRRDTLELAQHALGVLGMDGAIAVFRKKGTMVTLPDGRSIPCASDLLVLTPRPSDRFLAEVGSNIPRKNAWDHGHVGCEWCAEPFPLRRPTARAQRDRFCSRPCAAAAREDAKARSGWENPRALYPRIKPCEICSTPFEPGPSERLRAKTCSKSCAYKLRWQTRRGNAT